jgi:hypothetical protein
LTAPSGGSASACIDVDGRVLGDIIPGSTVSLFRTSSVNYSTVMNTIREALPVKRTTVNESAGFKFNCLDFGKYAFVIPASSYNMSVGFPLPYEFDCPNISLEIAFQGGDSQYAVGAFSLINVSEIQGTTCIDNVSPCAPVQGSLYQPCPFHPE